MSGTRVPRSLARRIQAEFSGRCGYCHTTTAITGARLVIDHIVPEVAGGATAWENLCLACHSCNEFKGARESAHDPVTGSLVRLFHPRRQRWRRHFRWSDDGAEIVGMTRVGRATVAALQLNHIEIVAARRRWVSIGWHPPPEDTV